MFFIFLYTTDVFFLLISMIFFLGLQVRMEKNSRFNLSLLNIYNFRIITQNLLGISMFINNFGAVNRHFHLNIYIYIFYIHIYVLNPTEKKVETITLLGFSPVWKEESIYILTSMYEGLLSMTVKIKLSGRLWCRY